MTIRVFAEGDRVVKTSATREGVPFGGYPPGTKGVVEVVDDDPNPATVTYGVMFEGANSIEVCEPIEIELELEAPVELPVERADVGPVFYDGTHIQIKEADAVYRVQKGKNGTGRQHGVVKEVFDEEARGMIGVTFGQRSDVECVRSNTLTFEGRGIVGSSPQVPTLPPAPPPSPADTARAQSMDGHSGLDPVTKDTNPKDALAGYKPRWFSFLPLRVLIGVGMAMFEGGWKYGKHNYRQSGVRASVYVDAAVCGHLMPWMEGQDVDENGRCHIEKAIASLMVLKDSMLGGNWIDDRPLAAPGFQEQVDRDTEHFQKMKVALKEKFGDPVAPYTEANRNQPR